MRHLDAPGGRLARDRRPEPVEHRGGGDVDAREARALRAQRHVHVLRVEEELLCKLADTVEHLAPPDGRPAACPGHGPGDGRASLDGRLEVALAALELGDLRVGVGQL